MNFDLIFARVVKVVGLALGSGIMVYETGWDHTDRPYLYAAALMLMGLQVAEVVERVAAGFGQSKEAKRLDGSKEALEKK